jgi:hypothetical protein
LFCEPAAKYTVTELEFRYHFSKKAASQTRKQIQASKSGWSEQGKSDWSKRGEKA